MNCYRSSVKSGPTGTQSTRYGSLSKITRFQGKITRLKCYLFYTTSCFCFVDNFYLLLLLLLLAPSSFYQKLLLLASGFFVVSQKQLLAAYIFKQVTSFYILIRNNLYSMLKYHPHRLHFGSRFLVLGNCSYQYQVLPLPVFAVLHSYRFDCSSSLQYYYHCHYHYYYNVL